MPSVFSDKTALITGGSSGIGLAIACQLAGAGAHVWLLARTPERLQQARAQVEGARLSPQQRIETLQADVSDASQIDTVTRQVLNAAGAPDYLFNCAGVVQPGYVQKLDPSVFHEMMDINFFGTLHITQNLLPAMLERRQGHIVNFGSVASYIGLIGYSAYSASKYALRGYSDVLRMELAPHGLHVTIVYPANTDTPQLAYDIRYKPAELHEIENIMGASKPITAEMSARLTLRGVARRKYQVFPGSESLLFYRLTSLAMGFTYPVMDWLLRKANQRLSKTQAQHSLDGTN